MTTRISIKKTYASNQHDAMVDVLDIDGNVKESHRVKDGEWEAEFDIHAGQSLVVHEVEKEADPEPELDASEQLIIDEDHI